MAMEIGNIATPRFEVDTVEASRKIYICCSGRTGEPKLERWGDSGGELLVELVVE